MCASSLIFSQSLINEQQSLIIASPLGCSNLCNLLEKRLVTASHFSLSYPMGSLASFLNNNNIEDYKNLEIEELIQTMAL